MTVEIKLGDHENIPVPEQRIGYLENKARTFFKGLSGLDLDAGDLDAGAFIAKLSREQAYELLCIVVPKVAKRMPLYEFAGYASQEAMVTGDYDEDADKSPTFPEIVNAFETAVKVNRWDIFKSVIDTVKGMFGKADPKVLGQAMDYLLAETVSRYSLSSPPTNGESAPMSSTTSPPTTTLPVA